MIFYGGKSYPCSFVIKFITKHLINSTRDNVRNDISLHKVSSPINSKRLKVNTANAKFTTCGNSKRVKVNTANAKFTTCGVSGMFFCIMLEQRVFVHSSMTTSREYNTE
jgi:hypothetical protein